MPTNKIRYGSNVPDVTPGPGVVRIGVDSDDDQLKYKTPAGNEYALGLGIGATSVETVAATNVITAAENGKVFYLSAAAEFVSTLPAPAAGLRFSFIVAAAPSGASYTIVTNASANIIVGKAFPADGAAGDTGATDDTISFVDGQAVAGDRVDVISNGTVWYAYAFCSVAAGVTFTTAS